MWLELPWLLASKVDEARGAHNVATVHVPRHGNHIVNLIHGICFHHKSGIIADIYSGDKSWYDMESVGE